jgi:hypothetical protein
MFQRNLLPAPLGWSYLEDESSRFHVPLRCRHVSTELRGIVSYLHGNLVSVVTSVNSHTFTHFMVHPCF